MSTQRILIVEDSPTVRAVLRAGLEDAGYAVLEAGDAMTALEMLDARRPDLVVVDLVLPDADGLELIAWMRAAPAGAEVPVVVLSGFGSRLNEARAAATSPEGVLLKPVSAARLVEAVRQHLPALPPALPPDARRLLLVDDNAPQRKLDTLRFENAGFLVTATASGEEALQAVRERAPDVVVTDVLMPEMDGFELCQTLREDPALAHVPIVLVSAHYDEDRDFELGRGVGATALVLRANSQHVVQSVLDAVQSGPGPLSTGAPKRRSGDRDRRVIGQLNKSMAHQARLEERASRQAVEMSLLGGIADSLTRSGDTDTTLRDVFRATVEKAGISAGALYLRDGDGAGPIVLRQAVGFSHLAPADGFFGCAALLDGIVERGRAVSIPSPDVPAADAGRILAASEMLMLQVVPLVCEGESVGALVLGALATDLERDGLGEFARAVGSQIVHSMALLRAFARTRAAELSLRQANAELEAKVAARTRDLSEANAALEHTVRVRQDMIAIVSHDLRNPLQSISLSTATMLRMIQASRPVTERDVARVGRAADQMRQLITNLLDFLSIEDRAFVVDRKPVPVGRLLDEALDAHLPLAEAKSLRLEVATAATDGVVACDAERLLYVFSNLIGNAIKFTPSGGRIALGAKPTDAAGWTFSVADSGAGIAPGHLPYIFDRYWQGKATDGRGVGLGLAIAKGIVEAHGGRLWAESVVGHGATFQFTLPALAAST